MTELATEIFAVSQNAIFIGLFVFLRVGGVMAVLPAFGERSVPERVRLVLAIAFTLIVAPAVSGQVSEIIDFYNNIFIILIAETVIGIALGLTIRFFIIALQIAGSIAAQSTSLAQIFGTASIEPLPAIGHFMVLGGLALAVLTGLHVRVAEALINSYVIFPPGSLPDPSVMGDWGVQQIGRAFNLAFTLAAPFVIASFIYNLALGVINKAMPQLMVAFVGAPAITAGGLIILLLALPVLLNFWVQNLNNFLVNPYWQAR